MTSGNVAAHVASVATRWYLSYRKDQPPKATDSGEGSEVTLGFPNETAARDFARRALKQGFHR